MKDGDVAHMNEKLGTKDKDQLARLGPLSLSWRLFVESFPRETRFNPRTTSPRRSSLSQITTNITKTVHGQPKNGIPHSVSTIEKEEKNKAKQLDHGVRARHRRLSLGAPLPLPPPPGVSGLPEAQVSV